MIMKIFVFTLKDQGSDRGCFTVIISATSIEAARAGLGDHFYQKSRDALIPLIDTIPFRVVHMNDLHLIYSDLEKGIDTEDHDREEN